MLATDNARIVLSLLRTRLKVVEVGGQVGPLDGLECPLYTSGPPFVGGVAAALMTLKQVGELPRVSLFASTKLVSCHLCMDANPSAHRRRSSMNMSGVQKR